MGILNLPRIPRGASLEQIANIYNMAIEEMEHRVNGFLQSNNIQEVGGWRVSADQLASKDGDVGMSTNDEGTDPIRLWAGGVDKETAVWKVLQSGIMQAIGAIIGSATSGMRVVFDETGIHAYDDAGIERITIGTTPAKGAKAIVFRDNTGVERAVVTYDTETLDGASMTGQYFTGPNGQALLFRDDGSFRLLASTGAGLKSEGSRPQMNDGFGWSDIAKKSEVDAKANAFFGFTGSFTVALSGGGSRVLTFSNGVLTS